MIKQLFLLFLVSYATSSLAQSKVLFQDAQAFDTDRYKGVKGSCFLFEDWVEATLYDLKDADYKKVKVNYNGETGQAEAINNDMLSITIDRRDIKSIHIPSKNDATPKDLHFLDTIVMVTSPHKDLTADYYIQLIANDNRALYLGLDASIITTTETPPGEIIERKRFNKHYQYILIENDSVTKFSTNKKAIKKAMKPYGDINKWCKANNKKYSTHEGIVSFIAAL